MTPDILSPDIAALLVTSFAIGIVIGLTGMGGGALMTPALIFLGVPPTSAVANDLVAAAVNKSTGAAVHWREGSPHRGIATWLIAGSLPTAFAGAFIVQAAGEGEERDAFLKVAIGITLLIAACTYALRLYVEMRRKALGQTVVSAEPTVRPLPTLLVGAFGGLLVGITSVGSGSVIMVVLLVLYPALAGVRLVGTDLVQAVPLVTAAAISHVIVTGIDPAVLIPLVVGGTPGTFLGARLANRVSQSIVRRGIVLVLFLTGLSMLKVPPWGVALAAAVGLVVAPLVWRMLRTRLAVSAEGRKDRPLDGDPGA
ncbi:sulfite exporter TauE/SafE family protein [Aeromicrobium sp.]|uniref:sulfite exporter TauE/SafE family protein n=1 Tax=Aeromicrobium sp. TaxID=1871063 RepID=UPI003D6C164E